MLQDLLDSHIGKLRSELESKFFPSAEDTASLQTTLLEELRRVHKALGNSDSSVATTAPTSSSPIKKTASLKGQTDIPVAAFSLSHGASHSTFIQPFQPVLQAINSTSTSNPTIEVAETVGQIFKPSEPLLQSERKTMERARAKENVKAESVKEEQEVEQGEKHRLAVRKAQRKLSTGDFKSFHDCNLSVRKYDFGHERPSRAQKDVGASSSKEGKAGPRKSRSMVSMHELSHAEQISPQRMRSAESEIFPVNIVDEKVIQNGSTGGRKFIPSQPTDGIAIPSEIVFTGGARAGPRSGGVKVAQALLHNLKAGVYGHHYGFSRSRQSSISGPAEASDVEQLEELRWGAARTNLDFSSSVKDLRERMAALRTQQGRSLTPVATEIVHARAQQYQKFFSLAETELPERT